MLDNQQQLKGEDIQAKCPSRYEGKEGSNLMKDSPTGRATYPNGT
jgi:hypothetical protein